VPYYTSYAASKHGFVGLDEALRHSSSAAALSSKGLPSRIDIAMIEMLGRGEPTGVGSGALLLPVGSGIQTDRGDHFPSEAARRPSWGVDVVSVSRRGSVARIRIRGAPGARSDSGRRSSTFRQVQHLV
jgi:hypothetical protein